MTRVLIADRSVTTHNLSIDVCDPTGTVVFAHQTAHNLVVNNGLNLVRDAIADGIILQPSRFSLGQGGDQPLPSDANLQFSILQGQPFTDLSKGDKAVIITYFLTSQMANGFTLREAGLLNINNVLFARVVFQQPIVKTTAISVRFVWTISLGAE
jgi:hypothetical protein